MDVTLAYGIRGGKAVHISEIGQEEKGERCGCVCPVCGGALVARLGEVNRHHFAHKAVADCDVSRAQQTGLHLLAKEILRENSRILVPGFSIERSELVPEGADGAAAAEVEMDLPARGAADVEYAGVEIEKALGGVVADAVIMARGKPCIVEIAVTHFVDGEKRGKLRALGLPAFEIDLSDLADKDLSRREIEKAVLADEACRYWVYNPLRERLLREKREEFRRLYEETKRKRDAEEAKKREARQQNADALRKAMEPENYAAELRRLRDDAAAAAWLKRCAFARETKEFPFYMDIPITGEIVFDCDRRIWQGKLFEDYYYKGYSIFLPGIQKKIYGGRMPIRFDKSRTCRTTVTLGGREETVSFSYGVIRRYFYYLEMLGFLTQAGGEWFTRKPVSLKPPNAAAAEKLQRALGEVDPYDPDVDRRVDEMLAI